MKFNVQSKALSAAVSAVSKVINSKNAMTILNNFLFDVKGDMLYITGSDLENTLVQGVKLLSADAEIRFCVDARKTVDLLKELPDIGVTFEVNPDTFGVKISYPGGNYEFVGLNGSDYPNTKGEAESAEVSYEMTIPASLALRGIDNTSFAVGTETVRPQMMGILWDMHIADITFVATDTHKLVRFIDTSFAPGFEASFILPVKPAVILKNILDKEADVKVSVTSQNVTFESGNTSLCSSFIKGAFPAYNKVIPVNNPYTLTIDRLQILNAVKRMLIFGDQGNKLIKFKLTPEQLIIKAEDISFCSLGQEMLRCDYNGPEMVLGFSAQYLIEIFSTLDTENVFVQLADPSRPGIFVPSENEEKTDLVILLMPMSVKEF